MLKDIVAELMTQQEPLQILALCTKEELAQLSALGLPVNEEDTYLSMQHMCSMQQKVSKKLRVLAITPNEEEPTEAERALIYALLIRSRKVISCRDKLEDMLKYDDREGWYDYKLKYDTKVLDLYKATWREVGVYPYIIVDNIKSYNKEESYILKELYTHLSERTPGKINPGDKAMIKQLQRMFSDISTAMLKPAYVIVGNIQEVPELAVLAEKFAQDASVKVVKLA